MEEKIWAFMEDMHSLDAERVVQWFEGDATLWIPPAQPVEGLSRIKALFRLMFRRYESLGWEILEILPVKAGRCIFVCRSKGKFKGCEPYTNYVMTDVTFNEVGKIVRLSDFFKDTAVFAS